VGQGVGRMDLRGAVGVPGRSEFVARGVGDCRPRRREGWLTALGAMTERCRFFLDGPSLCLYIEEQMRLSMNLRL